MADAPLTPEDFDLLAAELALGVLDGEDRGRALRLQIADIRFREAVLAWQARFEPLLHGYSEAEAPDLWRAIEQRLPREAIGSAPLGSLANRVRIWRIGAIAASAVAAGLAALLLFRPADVAPPKTVVQIAQAAQPAVARLGEADGAAQLMVNYDGASGELRIRALKMPQSKLAPELWVIPSDNVPRSLGLVRAAGSTRVTISPALRAQMQDGATLAITMEPVEGAPHKAPSSTPIAAGQIHII